MLLFAGSTREILTALYAIEHELERITHAGRDHGVAHMKLKWWHEEIDRLSRGTPAHPLTRRLYTALGAHVDYSRLHERLVAAELLLSAQTNNLLTTPLTLNAFFYRLHGAFLQILTDALLPLQLPTPVNCAALDRAAAVTDLGAALGKAIGWCDYLYTTLSPSLAGEPPIPLTHADAYSEALKHLSTADALLEAWPVGTKTSLSVLAALTRARVQRLSRAPDTPLRIFSELLTAWGAARRAARSE
jgi:hypothetical protein